MSYPITAAKEQIKLAVTDDHNLFRKGLIKLIKLADKDNKYSILFEADNGLDMQEKLKSKDLPDIILMDIAMPDMDGYEAVAWLQKFYPAIKILVVSMFESEEAIIRMWRMGVKGYLSKKIEVEDMELALHEIITKGFHFSSLVAETVTKVIQNGDPFNRPEGPANPVNGLTENEREFLKYACTDLSYVQIADKMNLSHKTIDGYRESLFSKFNVKSRVSMAMYAVRNKYVILD